MSEGGRDARHERLSELFARACDLPAKERRAFAERECAQDPKLRDELLELLARDDSSAGPIPVDPSADQGTQGSSPSRELLERLSAHRPQQSRYQLLGEIARGGMGAILKVWDADLRRHLAMKVVLGRGGSSSGETPEVDERVLQRFLEEAQITGQLDHPGVVPVHELGLDQSGRVFFTMRLVKGRDLKQILELARQGEEGWTQTRVLGVLLKACEAMAYAHDKRVVHRDLKPANVMVGRFGETYVMDWGLGRVLDGGERLGVRLDGPGPDALSGVHTYRADEQEGSGDELLTRDGDVIGTPAYMAPEQARGERERTGPASDVYSLGAVLYELLTGVRPYHEAGGRPKPIEVWRRLLASPPAPVAPLAPHAAPELVAICEKALAREPEERYPDAGALAEDLRAYLENRVVRAHRTGPLVELRKWIARNRLAAAALAAVLVVATSAGFVIAAVERAHNRDVRRSLDAHLATSLVDGAQTLWPIDAARTAELDRWEARAHELLARVPSYEAELARFEEEHAAGPRTPLAEGEGFDEAELDHVEQNGKAMRDYVAKIRSGEVKGTSTDIDLLEQEIEWLAGRERVLSQRREDARPWRYEDPGLEQVHGELLTIARAADEIALPELGWRDRLTARRRVCTPAAASKETRVAWDQARAALRDPAQAPAYGGLDLGVQDGLVPLGPDPTSGLWEFWHVASGERPQRGADGAWKVDGETGIVLVLVPGGIFTMGSGGDPHGPNYVDPARDFPEQPEPIHANETPPHDVTLAPYFLSKYELTQGQWLRLTGSNPSKHHAGLDYEGEKRFTRAHPVESISWNEAHRVLAAWDLVLPTEAQWERAARAGSSRPFWGAEGTFASIADLVDLGDASLRKHGSTPPFPDIDDGYGLHAPVDAFPGNPFGFYGITGNVWEWCLDWFCPDYTHVARIVPGTGEHVPDFSVAKAARGGSYESGPADLRVARRVEWAPDSVLETLGVRPARRVESSGDRPQEQGLSR